MTREEFINQIAAACEQYLRDAGASGYSRCTCESSKLSVPVSRHYTADDFSEQDARLENFYASGL